MKTPIIPYHPILSQKLTSRFTSVLSSESFVKAYCIFLYLVAVEAVGVEVSDNLSKPALSFHQVCPGNRMWVIKLGSKQFYFLNHLASPSELFLVVTNCMHLFVLHVYGSTWYGLRV